MTDVPRAFADKRPATSERTTSSAMIKPETTNTFPTLDSDRYGYQELIPDRDRDLVLGVRDFMQREVRPIANDHWASSEFPHQLVPKLAQLGIVGPATGWRAGRRPAGWSPGSSRWS